MKISVVCWKNKRVRDIVEHSMNLRKEFLNNRIQEIGKHLVWLIKNAVPVRRKGKLLLGC